MNSRLKELRKTLGLTLEAFGERLGVGKSAISDIEHGRNKLSNQMVNSICKTDWPGDLRVSEAWLRHGTGSMFAGSPPEEEMLRRVSAAQPGGLSSMQLRFIRAAAQLPPGKLQMLEKIMLEMACGAPPAISP